MSHTFVRARVVAFRAYMEKMNVPARKVFVFVLIASFILSPTTSIFAQSVDDQSATTTNDQAVDSSTSSDVSVGTPTTTAPSLSDLHLDSVASSSAQIDSSTAPTGETRVEDINSSPAPQEQPVQERAPPKKTNFKKDSALPESAQLAAVRQHLIDSGLPQEIIDRLDAYEASEKQAPEQPGLFSKITDFVTGNTDAAKEQAKADELAKKQPFKIEKYGGSINTAPETSYGQTFSNKQEQSGGLLQKIKNLLHGGTLKNLNFDNTKKSAPFSWIFGQKVFAVSDNPSDYLAAGGEITFSQAIKDKADALGHNPLSILNFVRNNITYVPYYGSKKGSDATLVERAGNDTDKASLLIAMLRYSGVPARYRQVDAKMSIGTITDLLGVESAVAAAQVLSLTKIPYTVYTDSDGNPLYFVIEHTYIEAYIPYGYSRGANVSDGGESQWVPMDPSVNAYYYEQPIDTVSRMAGDGFIIQQFFDNYLNNGSSTLEPLDAFKAQATASLVSGSNTSTYDNALMRSYPKDENLDFIPGSLPYEVAADLNTYDYMPTSLRHTIAFTVKDDQNTTVLSHTAYVSDLADKELLLTYDPASQADQDTLDTFDTIYDVVPLSLVAVKPAIKVNGTAIATASASTTLGQAQSYAMEFDEPTRAIGGSVSSEVVDTVSRTVITGNTDAIALDTDRVTPSELRPSQDTQTTSFVANHVLYQTASDFLYRLQGNQSELVRIIGGDFTNAATRATVFNGIDVTYASSGAPYSFSWKGLRIDSSSKVKYFNRFNDDTTTHFKEFTGIFGLQASQEESDIFEDNFNVQSVATVKGLKLVASSTFSGITLHKINSANESDIDSLTSISTTTRSAFHTAVEAGKTIYTPSAPVTYGTWNGLFYISIDFNGGTAAYTIGEGLNGGFSACALPGISSLCNWTQDAVDLLRNQAEASGNIGATISVNTTLASVGETVTAAITYVWNFFGTIITWVENKSYSFNQPGSQIIKSDYGATSTVSVAITKVVLGNPDNKAAPLPFDGKLDDLFIQNAYISNTTPQFTISADLLKAVIAKESGAHFDFESYRYEPCHDATFIRPDTTFHYSSYYPWANYWINDLDAQGNMAGGAQINEVKNAAGQRPWEFSDPLNSQYPLKLVDLNGDGKITVYEIWKENDPVQHYSDHNCTLTPSTANFAPQLLIAASYGPGQELYTTAVTRNNFDHTTGAPPSPGQKSTAIRKLFDPNVAIPDAVNNLKILYNNNLDLSEGCTTDLRTWTVLEEYNGTGQSAIDYANTLCRWWKVDKVFAPHIFDSATGLYVPYMQ